MAGSPADPGKPAQTAPSCGMPGCLSPQAAGVLDWHQLSHHRMGATGTSLHQRGICRSCPPHLGVPVQELAHVGLQPGKQVCVPYEPILHNLRDARGQLPVRQGVQGEGVYEHAARLIEGAYHVLAQGVVHPRLAAHRGVHRGHDCGGHLNKHQECLEVLKPA